MPSWAYVDFHAHCNLCGNYDAYYGKFYKNPEEAFSFYSAMVFCAVLLFEIHYLKKKKL